MKFKVQFSKGWQGTWTFDSPNDIRAWEIVKDYIKEHTQTINVDIQEICELDESGNSIRKLDNYENYFSHYRIHYEKGDCIFVIDKNKTDYFIWEKAKRDIKKKYDSKVNWIEEIDKTGNTIRKLDDYKEFFKTYKIHYKNKNCILKIDKYKSDLYIWEKAKKEINKEHECDIDWIEELDKINKNPVRRLGSYEECYKDRKNDVEEDENEEQEEQAIYKAYFSDGECSGPFIAKITENDSIALEMANYKLKQHADYNGIDVNKIKVIKVEELNENKLFEVNLLRKEDRKNRILSLKECG
jgi:hypothetical protein